MQKITSIFNLLYITIFLLLSTNANANIKEKEYEFYQNVPVLISAPSSSITGRPFIVIYRFVQSVSEFDKSKINIEQGSITYFAANKDKKVFRALVVPDSDIYKSKNPNVNLIILSKVGGKLSNKVRILKPIENNKNTLFSTVSLEPYFLAQFIVSRGGESINTSHDKIGNTMGVQLGFSFPLPKTQTALDQIIPPGSIRIHAGVNKQETGSNSDNNRMVFSSSTADVLYEVTLTNKLALIGGLSAALSPVLSAQNFQLIDSAGSYDAEVEMGNAYGLKILLEYTPSTKINGRGLFINTGFTIIDYIPKRIKIKGANDGDTTELETELLSSPTRIGGASVKLGFGYRY